ncbi:MAG: 3-hydroxyacyl-ACP dehydratase FabZ [Deltaproteobacteria bacterium]|nr:3-hydroxyacyl-ACP dehydratase FabZ [Deltaproteobacteria bacterium]
MDLLAIQRILPHRYPFLLVDRVVEWTANQKLKAYKNVTANEEFFLGHFPGHPVMPGVLIVEALAQASGLLAYNSNPWKANEKVMYLMGLDGVRFRRPVVPGDRLDLEVTLTKQKSTIWKLACVASVDGKPVAEAEIMATIADKAVDPAAPTAP